MDLQVVFFGNSQSVFSNRFFWAFGEAPCEVVGVVDTAPDRRTSTTTRSQERLPDFVETADRQGIPALDPPSPNTPEFVQAIQNLNPDLLVAAGYSNLLGESILSVPRIAAVNFHASLLPAYRGKHPVFWALRNGEPYSGLTAHIIDRGLDTGDILYQVKVATRKQDTVNSLYERIMDRSVGLVDRLVRDAAEGNLEPRPQPDEGVSYFSAVSEDDFRLDWSLPADVLWRLIQTTPGKCFNDVKGQRVFWLDAEPVSHQKPALPGTLLEIGRTYGAVSSGVGAVRLRRVELDDGQSLSVPQLCQQLGLQSSQPIITA